MTDSQVTIVVVPRERFSFTRESLESVYENTQYSFELVYVDNHAPANVRCYLEAQAQEKGFQLIRSDRYLPPNAARNLGLRQVNSKYVVFLDNDVVVSPDWLKPLIDCAEETKATVVGPVVCQYEPLHEIVHCAGGEYMSSEELARFLSQDEEGKPFKPSIQEKIYLQDRRIAEVSDRLQRQPTGFIEFHCLLVRTEFFERVGLLDEGLCCTKEYIDLALTVAKFGGSIYLEPASVVTFRTHFPAPPLKFYDLPYFMLRWSDAWERSSLRHFCQKWNLAEDEYFQNRYKELGWRRRIEFVRPQIARLQFLGENITIWIRRILVRLERAFNFCLSTFFAWRWQRSNRQPASLSKQ
ncbi:MAG: glycosyltransferase [Hydrococcus sp. Prado102]|jgi:GT2 family glycosyltransferase|nr:glycosyltransferase [Hydrococcus sp. Prado102]